MSAKPSRRRCRTSVRALGGLGHAMLRATEGCKARRRETGCMRHRRSARCPRPPARNRPRLGMAVQGEGLARLPSRPRRRPWHRSASRAAETSVRKRMVPRAGSSQRSGRQSCASMRIAVGYGHAVPVLIRPVAAAMRGMRQVAASFRHLALRRDAGGVVSIRVIFCQIFRDRLEPRSSTSFTALATPSSGTACA